MLDPKDLGAISLLTKAIETLSAEMVILTDAIVDSNVQARVKQKLNQPTSFHKRQIPALKRQEKAIDHIRLILNDKARYTFTLCAILQEIEDILLDK